MSDINRLAPHAFACSMINQEDDNSVQAVINTNYCGQQGISNAKVRKVPKEMQSHNKTMSPNYPESLQHCCQRQEELIHWGPEHKGTERLLLWADSHGERAKRGRRWSSARREPAACRRTCGWGSAVRGSNDPTREPRASGGDAPSEAAASARNGVAIESASSSS